MDLSTATITELKAAVYDQMVIVENAQKNIQILNQAIAKKTAPESKNEATITEGEPT